MLEEKQQCKCNQDAGFSAMRVSTVLLCLHQAADRTAQITESRGGTAHWGSSLQWSWYRVPKVRGCEPQELEEESHFPPSPTTSGCCLLTACLDKPHGAPSSLLAKETCWRQCFGSRNLCPDTKHTRYPTSSAPMGQLTQTSSIMEESKKD